ncbi:hypothetical protein [Mesorhizobium sp. M2A.F.Ca.ET.039.01.1.1]|uniref:hypothetical protein n=1 Tax=Mesorhizobium sp. M2A.F.Ca.ET.039.01.1.1 TaxID=2496746 RepID=UPI000FCC0C31|nr:hypothetical protein [Mesorhizobium sp. M2A.F.Ca.ET.039.01.1.1]RWX72587.1 hypothetical protein EOA24_00925 [Mesorhizobium sp. M2A.F.Ca.ET.039.01.1.1]
MSLVALAARIATVKALENATLAAGRVFDSAIDPIDQKIAEEAVPVLIVYTDDDVRTVTGRDLINATRQLDLVVESAVASKVTYTQGDDQVEAIEIPFTDAGLELTLNFMDRQIARALLSDQGPWAALWRRIVLQPSKITSKRGGSSEKGVRFAARQMTITAETLSEPGFGAQATEFWADFLAALESDADPALHKLAAMIRAEIETPTLPAWRQAIAELGVNPSTAQAIGIAPLPEGDSVGSPVAVITTNDQDGDDWTLDQAAIDAALEPEVP